MRRAFVVCLCFFICQCMQCTNPLGIKNPRLLLLLHKQTYRRQVKRTCLRLLARTSLVPHQKGIPPPMPIPSKSPAFTPPLPNVDIFRLFKSHHMPISFHFQFRSPIPESEVQRQIKEHSLTPLLVNLNLVNFQLPNQTHTHVPNLIFQLTAAPT